MSKTFSDRLREAAAPVWERCWEHSFLTELRLGTLDQQKFIFYMKQDYVYLIDYAKLFAYGSLKARDLETMGKFAELLHSTLHVEMSLHRQYGEQFGLSQDEMEATVAAPVTTAYTKYMLDAAASGSFAELVSALLPCMWSYREFGQRMAAFPGALEHPLYRHWVEMYASEDFDTLTNWTIDLMNRLAEGLPERELAVLEERFVVTSKFEYMFWDMAYKQEDWLV